VRYKTIVINQFGTFESDPSIEMTEKQFEEFQIEFKKETPLVYLTMIRGNQWIIFQDKTISNAVIILEEIDDKPEIK
jgi:hypothetical protein